MTLRCFIARTNGTITLPATALYTIWIWGAGGPGGDANGVSIGGGGSGGGGFDETTVFGTIADEWTIHLGDGTAGSAAANDTWVQLEDDSYAVRVGSGPDATGYGSGLGGYAPNNLSGLLNAGTQGGAFGGGGGGGSSGGPHAGLATGSRGGAGFNYGWPAGGGGGGCIIGQIEHESQAEAGTYAGADSEVGDGGHGYYGTGSGAGGNPGADGTTNLGAGGGGAQYTGDAIAGGDGSSWDYILGLDGDEWIDAPFTYSTSASGAYAVISNNSVPGGGGGGGGARPSGAGGDGGFPGGGGGGGGYPAGVGGDGGDGLVIIFYSTDGVSAPPIEEGPTPSVGEDDVVSYEARTYITKVRQLRPNPRPPFNEYAVGATERTTFPVSFRIMEQANLRVTVDDVELDQGDFTFTGRSVERIPGYETGRVTLDTAVSNCLVRIWSDPLPARETDLIPNVV